MTERALIDITRVALAGNTSGVRQLCRRLLKDLPDDSTHPDAFREELLHLYTSSPSTKQREPQRSTPGLRSAQGRALTLVPDSETPMDLIDLSEDTHEPVYEGSVAEELARVTEERLQSDRLMSHGIHPTTKVLLTGAPGTGKSTAARFLARKLDLPLVRLNLAEVMSSFLGRTGQNLRVALREAQQSGGIILLDEFDAVAKRRNDDSDIGELKRLVNVLLLELDEWPSSCLLVAATNHPEVLDRAIERRFDLVLDLGLPSLSVRQTIIADRLGVAESDPAVQLCSLATEGLSGSDIQTMTDRILRRAILADSELLSVATEEGIEVLRDRTYDRATRDAVASAASHNLGWSNRRIAKYLGVSHPTVSSALSRAGGKASSRA